VVGCSDPNPIVNGAGTQRLRDAGVEVQTGVLQSECAALIRAFSHWIQTGKPLVTLKVASSLDGRIATRSGQSQWVTGELARNRVHQMRQEADAVMVGGATVRADNPRLTVRLDGVEAQNPVRVVVSAALDLPDDAVILAPEQRADTWILTGVESPKRVSLEALGVRTSVVGGTATSVDLAKAIEALGAAEITAVLVEGGQHLATALLEARLVDRLCVFVAPKVVGGDGLNWAGSLGVTSMDQAISLTDVGIQSHGDDVCIEGTCVYGNH